MSFQFAGASGIDSRASALDSFHSFFVSFPCGSSMRFGDLGLARSSSWSLGPCWLGCLGVVSSSFQVICLPCSASYDSATCFEHPNAPVRALTFRLRVEGVSARNLFAPSHHYLVPGPLNIDDPYRCFGHISFSRSACFFVVSPDWCPLSRLPLHSTWPIQAFGSMPFATNLSFPVLALSLSTSLVFAWPPSATSASRFRPPVDFPVVPRLPARIKSSFRLRHPPSQWPRWKNPSLPWPNYSLF
ncbi:hypothetical protein R1flu_006107 [Riccia fluitans]|uniref:Uncharacterized protein n=1 Tax=Riccia fluitans TaxID=41844 RepID=A0ABD1YVU6_9MARC